MGPDQTGTVRVYAAVPTNAALGSKDKITLTSQGVTLTSQAAYLTVTSTGTQDPWQPYIWFTYGSRCDGKTTPGNCAGSIWSVEVSAVDNESGMLRLQSSPKGLLIRSPFIAGTNDEVKGTFTASCCDPRVTITAYDMNRNQRTIQLDVRDIYLSEFGIATVVLGCLFFIVLIILLIILCKWCIKRKRESRDLPVYRGDSRP